MIRLVIKDLDSDSEEIEEEYIFPSKKDHILTTLHNKIEDVIMDSYHKEIKLKLKNYIELIKTELDIILDDVSSDLALAIEDKAVYNIYPDLIRYLVLRNLIDNVCDYDLLLEFKGLL